MCAENWTWPELETIWNRALCDLAGLDLGSISFWSEIGLESIGSRSEFVPSSIFDCLRHDQMWIC